MGIMFFSAGCGTPRRAFPTGERDFSRRVFESPFPAAGLAAASPCREAAGPDAGGRAQLLPMAEMPTQSTRASATPQFVNLFAADPWNLLQLVAACTTTMRGLRPEHARVRPLRRGRCPCWPFGAGRSPARGGLRGLAWSRPASLWASLCFPGRRPPLVPAATLSAASRQVPSPLPLHAAVPIVHRRAGLDRALLFIVRCQHDEKAPWRRLWPLLIPTLASVASAALGLAMRKTWAIAALGLAVRKPWPVAPTPAVLAGPALIGLATLLVATAARGRRAAILGLILLVVPRPGLLRIDLCCLCRPSHLAVTVLGR